MLEKFKKIISEYSEIDLETITEETSIRTDLGVNSFEIMSIIMEIEKQFEVEIPDREIVNIQTVGDLFKFIENNK